METVEIKCPKSMLNVAERAKKGRNRYISGFRACSGRRGRRFKSCYPDHLIRCRFSNFFSETDIFSILKSALLLIFLFSTLKINFTKKSKNKIKNFKEYSNINTIFSLNFSINFFKSVWRFKGQCAMRAPFIVKCYILVY